MHHQPKPQDQARILKAALKTLKLDIKHQDALEVAAKMMGYRDWKTMSASSVESVKAPVMEVVKVAQPIPLSGPSDGDIYEGLVVVSETRSAMVRVRAHSREEAVEMLPEAGRDQYPRGFELDEGNYKGLDDFHVCDDDSVENVTGVQFESEGNYFARADWKDEEGREFYIGMTRDEPDSGSDDRRAQVTVDLVVEFNGVSCSSEDSDYQVHGDLQAHLEQAFEEGDFDIELQALLEQLTEKLKQK